MGWHSPQNLSAKPFTCGYCGKLVSSDKGYHSTSSQYVYVCPNCTHPTYFSHTSMQVPGVPSGNDVEHLPSDIDCLYKEARNCIAANSFTSGVLTCRKLLMNIAVSLKAKEGDSFIAYVEYLASQGYVPPNGRGWVDHIRKKGNEATHEIRLMTKIDAEELIAFLEMLLKFIYEFPSKVPKE